MAAMAAITAPGQDAFRVTASISGLSVTNDTGFLLDADQDNPVPDQSRAVLRAAVGLTVTFPPGLIAETTAQLRFQLSTAAGNPWPIASDNGAPSSSIVSITVRRPAIGGRTVNRLVVTSLRPAVRLDESLRYRVAVALGEDRGQGFQAVTNLVEQVGHRFFHFTNISSPDPALNALAAWDSAVLARGQTGPEVTARFTAARFDDFDQVPSTQDLRFQIRVALRDVGSGNDIPLGTDTFPFTQTLATHDGPLTPAEVQVESTVRLDPAAGALAYGHTYAARLTLEHLETDNTAIPHGTIETAPVPLAALSGKLFFGALETRFTEIANDPLVGQMPDPSFPNDGFLSTLAVINQSGYLPERPELTYGDGTPLPVHIFNNGDALYVGTAALILKGSINGHYPVGNARFGFARLELGQNGLSAFDAYAGLPAGSGFAVDPVTRLYQGRLPLGRVDLGGNGLPKQGAFTLKAADLGLRALWFHDEGLPLRLRTDSITWRPGSGEFEIGAGDWIFTRDAELAFVEGPLPSSVLDTDLQHPAGNDQEFRSARGTDGKPVRLAMDAGGRGRLDATVMLGAGVFEAHFPAGVTVPYANGAFVITNDVIDTTASTLTASVAETSSIEYRQGCPDPGCAGAATGEVLFQSADGVMHFTPDGGVSDGVDVTAAAGGPVQLEWGALGGGRYAHSVGAFSTASFHLPGFDLREDAGTDHLAADDRAGALLNTGYGQPEDRPVLERPFTDAYGEGLADYAGLNFRLAADGDATAVSYLAGQRVPGQGTYPLKANSKYYIRRAGVSGRHQAVADAFPHDLVLYGFKTSLDGLRLSYLDNRVDRSATDGGIEVPFPSDFVQSFAELRLRCNGQLLDARIEGESRHRLAYWLAPFQASTLEFRAAADAPCDTTAGVLLLGSAVTLPLVKSPALGVVGFWSDGHLVSSADNIPGVDSRLILPSSIEISGPEDRPYALTPATKAYFNRWPGAGGDPADGFVTFAGTLDLPWFLDAKVQVHAVGGGDNPLLYLAGGWNGNGHPDDPGRAWLDAGGHSFFDRQDFDPTNRGFPGGVSVTAYRDSGSQRFRPRAQQRLLGLVDADVDFPVAWQPGSRSFQSAGRQKANLLVFELQGEAERLTSRHAHLNFGATVTDQVPHFSASEFLLGQIEDRTGAFSAVSNAIVQVLSNNVLATTLRDGADDLDRLLSPDLGKLFGDDLLSAFDPRVNELLDEVQAAAQSGAVSASDFHAAMCQALAAPETALTRLQDQFLNTSAMVDGVSQRMLDALRAADSAVTSAITIVEPRQVSPQEVRRTVIAEIIKLAIRQSPGDAPPLVRALADKVAPEVLDALIDEYVGEALEPTLAEIEATLRQVHAALQDLVSDLAAGQGVLRNGLHDAQDAFIADGTFYQDASNAICDELRAETLPVAQALQDRARLRQRIERVLLAELLKGIFPKETHLLLKQVLLADRGLFRSALEELFAKVNDTVVGIALGPARDLVRNELGDLDNGVLQALEKLRDVLQGTRLYGTADIAADDLRKLRVDGEFRFALGPAEMGDDATLAVDGFYQVEQFHGDSPGRGCRPPGGSFEEVTFGASTTPANGFAQGLKVGVTGRFSLDNQGRLLGVAGGLGATGAKRIGGFTAQDPELGFSFGDEGAYLGGSAAGSFKGFGLQVRVFVGAACQLAQLDFIDSNTAAVLADNGIGPADLLIGYYVAGDITLPLERLLPISLPRTCLLHVEGRGGAGSFGFVSPVAGPAFLVGLRQHLGIEGEVLCLFSGEGDLDLVGAVGVNTLGSPQATIAGQLKLGVTLGICPLCDDVTKTFPWVAHLRTSDITFDSPF